ncbi:MAG: hypothetical protein DWP95_03370 [Proteobacteria bacterium]|nr:MAG: hypothetical protein DWP95_03370 [Pseudomonadota bacterium]
MKHKPIFILGRFRSGTSHFWHIFNQLSGFKAWYEPLHPQLLAQLTVTETKADHVHIDDYWAAYRELTELPHFHDVRFGGERLYLSAQESWPELRHYLDFLIDSSGDKRAVLQFNRMDFRLPWLKGFYPHANVVYLKRNPLQLWCSQRKHIAADLRLYESYADAYELMQWCADLAPMFPFLAPQPGRHAFYRFYVLYRLSVLMGTHHANVVIDLDEDVFNSNDYLDKLKKVSLSDEQLSTALSLKHVPGRYDIEAGELEQLSAIMTEVDALLTDSGLDDEFAGHTVAEIKRNNPNFWRQQKLDVSAVIRELTHSWHQEQKDKIELLNALDKLSKQSKGNE